MIQDTEQAIFLDDAQNPLNEEQRRIVHDGALANGLVTSPYWEEIMEYLRARAYVALLAMHNCKSSDERLMLNLQRRWRVVEDERQAFENHFKALQKDYLDTQDERVSSIGQLEEVGMDSVPS